MFTQIIPEHPGYTWVWDQGQWFLRWEPIPNVYSPPVFTSRSFETLPLPAEAIPILAFLIGKNGRFLKWITSRSDTHYIFVRHGRFEVWGHSQAKTAFAIRLLRSHIDHHLSKRKVGRDGL